MLTLLLACAPDTPEDPGWTYPLDDVLRVNHVQAEGTHNSYHVAGTDEGALAYTHAPLGVQLADQGVRQFELDVQYDTEARRHLVYHIPVVDQGTTCETLADCLGELRAWSDEHPGHHPLFVLVEPKQPYDEQIADLYVEDLETEIREAWPDRVLTPSAVQGEHPDLRTAIISDGWPTLGETRGYLVLSLLDREEWADVYTHGHTRLDHRLMFSHTDPASPVAGFVLMDDPTTDDVAGAVDAGLLVRTRADTDLVVDPARFQAGLDAGAQMLSTDVPAELEIPGGAPSRCNPRTAPAECTAEAIERL